MISHSGVKERRESFTVVERNTGRSPSRLLTEDPFDWLGFFRRVLSRLRGGTV